MIKTVAERIEGVVEGNNHDLRLSASSVDGLGWLQIRCQVMESSDSLPGLAEVDIILDYDELRRLADWADAACAMIGELGR